MECKLHMPGHIRHLNHLSGASPYRLYPFILFSILFSKSTHPLPHVVWCLFVSFYFPTLASASTQLRKRFRSGRRSWWSPSARQRSSAPPSHNVQRWPTCLKLFRRATINRRATTWKHVKMSPLAAFASFPLTTCFDSVLLKLLYLFLEWTQALQTCRREQGQSLLTCWRVVFMSCQQRNSLALSVDVPQPSVSRLATYFGHWDVGRASCLLLNTLSLRCHVHLS